MCLDKNTEIVLSICVLVYNHKSYIEECIESILNQKLRFKYEILVGNDCSTDGIEDILAKYEDCVNCIRIINRQHNLGLCANMYDLCLQAKGKYVINISGDDYFCDMNILQKMVDFLEEHPEYHSVSAWQCFMNVQEGIIREDSVGKQPMEYTLYDYLGTGNGLVIHGVMRNIFFEDRENNIYLTKGARNNEEIKWYFYSLSKGNKYILPESIYVYRYIVSENGSNYNSTHSYLDTFRDYYMDLLLMRELFGDKYNFKPLMLKKSNMYCIKLSDSLHHIREFLKIMKFQDIVALFWYKCYLKLHHRQDPPQWSNSDYYLKR